MNIVKEFMTNSLHTEIVIKGTHDDPLFRASDVGTILELPNIRRNIQKFDDTEKIVQITSTPGGDQKVTFLTEKGLLKILLNSQKPIAVQFQNWTCDIIKNIRLNKMHDCKEEMNNLNEQKETDRKQCERTKFKEKSILKEELLLRKYSNTPRILYIFQIKTFEDGRSIVKIGQTRTGIGKAFIECKYDYGECLLLDCFTVDEPERFWWFVVNEDFINSNKVTNLTGHEREQDLFLINDVLSYQTLWDFVQENVENFCNTNQFNEQQLTMLKLQCGILQMSVQSLKLNGPPHSNDEIIKDIMQITNDITYKVQDVEQIFLGSDTRGSK